MSVSKKVNVTYKLLGALQPSKEGEIKYVITGKDLLSNIGKKLGDREANKIVRKGSQKHLFRESKFVNQVTQISLDSYNYFTSQESNPGFGKQWNRMSKRDRLEKHLELIANDLRAESFSYEILED